MKLKRKMFEFQVTQRGVNLCRLSVSGITLKNARHEVIMRMKGEGFRGEVEIFVISKGAHNGNRRAVNLG